MPWSRTTSWRQGSVLGQEYFQSVGLTDTADAQMAVAISHDCDIANDNLDAEPFVEFIFAHTIAQANGNYTHGKNPRTLHLQYTNEGNSISLELIASKRVTIPKTLLENIQPNQSYELNSRHILQSWLAARYRRHALPNSLVDRLRSVFSYLEKEGKKNSSGILSFRLSYDPQVELPPAEPYELWINIVYITDQPEYASMAEKIAQSIKAEFPKLLEKTKEYGKVNLRQCMAVSEEEFTLRDMRETIEYHLEHLSYRTEPPDPTVI